MAESGAERTRRWRSHKAGDHSLCKRCAALSGDVLAPEGRGGQEIPAGERAKLRWLAEGLARAYQADPGNALLARELRMTLQALLGGGDGNDRDNDIEALFAEFSGS